MRVLPAFCLALTTLAAHAEPPVIPHPEAFVAARLAEDAKAIAALRARLGNDCQGAGADTSAVIAAGLPAPARLEVKVATVRPQDMSDPDLKLPATGDYYLHDVLVADIGESNAPGWTGLGARARDGELPVAVDAASATLLGLPASLAIEPRARVLRITPASHCYKREFYPSDGYSRLRVWPHAAELGIRLEAGPGVVIDGQLARFEAPGKRSLKATSSRRYSELPPLHPQGCPRIRPIDSRDELHFRAYRFKSLAYREMPQLAWFFDAEDVNRGGRTLGVLPPPTVWVEDGDKTLAWERGLFPVDRRWQFSAGPIQAENLSGNPLQLMHLGGVGSVNFRYSLAGMEHYSGSLSVNAVKVVLPPAMSGWPGHIAAGVALPLGLRVTGPVNLADYEVRWAAQGGTWQQASSGFADGLAENRLSVVQGRKEAVQIGISIVRKADGRALFAWNRIFHPYPAVRGLELLAGPDKPRPAQDIDLFFPGGEHALMLGVMATLADGSRLPLAEALPDLAVEIASSDPALLLVKARDDLNHPGVEAHPLERIGTVTLTARSGGADLVPQGMALQGAAPLEEVRSPPLSVRINRLTLLSGEGGWRLLVSGPTDMAGYSVEWLGQGRRRTTFTQEGGQAVSRLAAGATPSALLLRRGETVAARIEVARFARRANITLMPPEVPIATLDRAALPDAGSVESLSACRDSVRFAVEHLGFDPGSSIQRYCADKRGRELAEVAEARQQNQALNRLIREAREQGRELAILNDAMAVGAAVEGELAAFADSLFCAWRIEGAPDLALDSPLTPVQRVDDSHGGCLNRLSGLQNGLDPAARLQVDLLLMEPPGVLNPAQREDKTVVRGSWLDLTGPRGER